MVEAYFDESGTHAGSPVLCVGGFVIETPAARELDKTWLALLGKYHLPYFHMTDCAGGHAPFDRLGKQGCIDVETEAIHLIREYMTGGMMVSMYPSDFEEYVPHHPQLGTAYSVCVHGCLAGVQHWANRRNYQGDIAYCFESGHASQSEANAIMKQIFAQPSLRARQRYYSHTFADKKNVRLLQAADIIAWHWFTENKRTLERIRPNMRIDTQVLMGPNSSGADFKALHYSPTALKLITRSAYADLYPLTYPGQL
ncbi:MAG TPA: DUF3800 domain-containing protein [Candidatus Sulfotelmatobacter sp.]